MTPRVGKRKCRDFTTLAPRRLANDSAGACPQLELCWKHAVRAAGGKWEVGSGERMITIRETGLFGGVALAMTLAGCNSFDKPLDGSEDDPRLVIPLDERAPTTSTTTPPAISGGTLSVLSDNSV